MGNERTAGNRTSILWLAGFVVIAFSLILVAAETSAARYSAVRTLSETGQTASNADVAVDSSGRATIVWGRYDGTNYRVQAVRLAANGTPNAVQTLSQAGGDADQPDLAIDKSGRATVVWRQDDGVDYRIQSVRLAANGTPGTIRTLSDSGNSANSPQVAVDASGRATITWNRNDGSDLRVQAIQLAANGTPGTVRTLSRAGQSAYDPEVGADNAGRVTIAWYRSDGMNGRAQSVRLEKNGTPGAVQTHSAPGQYAYDIHLAVAGSGSASVVWLRNDGSNDRVQAVHLSASRKASATRTLSGSGQDADYPQISVDNRGRATVVWERRDGSDSRIQAVRLTASGKPGVTRTLSKPGQDASSAQVEIDRSARSTIVWYRFDGSNNRTQTVRLNPAGAPGKVQTLSQPGQNIFDPQVAVRGTGQASIIWQRDFGANLRIQAVTGLQPTVTVARPRGPAIAKRGRRSAFTVKITNTGNASASGVAVRVSGKGAAGRAVAGNIAVGATRNVKVRVRLKRPGRIKLAFRVSTKNAGSRIVRKTISVKR